MKRTIAYCCGALSLVIAGGITVPSVAQTTPFFYADGRKTELKLSSRYAAVRINPGTDVGPQAFGVAPESSAGDVPLLKENRIILIKRAPSSFGGRTFEDFLRLREQFNAPRSVPVYELDGADLIQPDQVIVKIMSEDWRTRIETQLKKVGPIQKDRYGRYIVSVPRESSLDIANKLSMSPGIQFAEPNFVTILSFSPKPPTHFHRAAVSASAAPAIGFPNDAYFSFQWGLHNSGVNGKIAADIEARPAWSAIRSNPNAKTESITIAIVDVGVDSTHPDLKGKIFKPYDATSKGKNPQDPYPWDTHGTECAGVAAATTDNSLGVASISLNARIMPIRVATSQKPIDPDDEHPWITTWDTIADGIETAIDQGADVLSNSWGGGYSNVVNDAIDYALKNGRKGRGAILVFAAGNYSSSVSWPANLSSKKVIIAVSATNEWDEFKTKGSHDGENWWGSNFGPEVTVAAPGVHIYTTTIHANTGKPQDDFIGDFNGTSSAAPLVAGVAALVLSQHPDWTPQQVRNQIEQTADQLSTKPRNDQFGYGRINACRAVGGNCRKVSP